MLPRQFERDRQNIIKAWESIGSPRFTGDRKYDREHIIVPVRRITGCGIMDCTHTIKEEIEKIESLKN